MQKIEINGYTIELIKRPSQEEVNVFIFAN